MWRGLRIAALLAVLVFVAAGAWVERHRTASWDGTLWIGIFPVAGDSSAATTDYLDGLSSERFASIERFFEREARRFAQAQGYGVDWEAVARLDDEGLFTGHMHMDVSVLVQQFPGHKLPGLGRADCPGNGESTDSQELNQQDDNK